jgi:hypothetical protein
VTPQKINLYGSFLTGIAKILLFLMSVAALSFFPWQVAAFIFIVAIGLDWRDDGRWFPWSPPARMPCRKCGGSGFSGYGTGYDAVCDWCGGYCEELYE